MKKLLLLSIAAMGEELLRTHGIKTLAGLPLRGLSPVSPAVTCVAQATLRTGLLPEAHGMTANGLFNRETLTTHFWTQSARLVRGPRFWETFRARGGRVGMYFFQQSLGEAVDEIVSPAPIHTHGGGLIMATYQQPERVLGVDNPLALWRYWGPLASSKVGRDIVTALCNRIRRGDAPELLCVYLPTLDYDLQRYGTHHPKSAASVRELVHQVENLATVAREAGYKLVLLGDYAITDVTGSVGFPNRVLRTAGLFATRTIKGMHYPDLYRSQAFALCDHQTANIFCLNPECKECVRELLAALPEVDTITDGIAGVDLEMTARKGCWFAYPWWETPREAPDYATHVDIHNKPGFDPCELFFGRNPFHCSTDVRRVKGTHGRSDAPVALATELPLTATSLPALVQELQAWLTT